MNQLAAADAALRHDDDQSHEGWRFELKRPDQPGLNEAEVERFIEGFIASMPRHKLAIYFAAKRYMFASSDFVVFAFDDAGAPAGLLMAKWYLCARCRRFLNLETLLIAERHQRSRLTHRMLAQLFAAVMQQGEDFPDYITMKTYTPRSYNIMNIFARNGFAGVRMYPQLDVAAQDIHMATLASDMAAVLAPDLAFDASCGVVRQGAGVIDDDFWPAWPRTRMDNINTFFRDHVGSHDRMLCLIHVPGAAAKEQVCQLLKIEPKPVVHNREARN